MIGLALCLLLLVVNSTANGLLLILILCQLTTFERKFCKAMSQIEEKIAEVAAAVNEGFTSLETTIITEVEQVAVLIQQNEPTHAINALENLKARVQEGFANARNAVANIVPDAPVEEPPADTPSEETTAPSEESA